MTKESLLTALDELEELIKARLQANSQQFEKHLHSLQDKNKKAYDILEKVISELESLLKEEELKCQK